jgi:cyanophycinase-like exopeptidase
MTTPSGPIALLGSGEFEPWTRSLDRTLLEAATTGDGTVAIVPTASALEGPVFDGWARKGLEHYAALGAPARVIDLRGRDDAERVDLVGGLDHASLIFFSGGNPAYLASTLAGSPFWEAVLGRLADGAAFAGCSAGACVAGAFAPDSVTSFVWEEGWVPGLELLPGAWVLPHFDALDRYRADLRGYFLSRVPEGGLALGVDERTAVVRTDGAWTVVGQGGAFVSKGRAARRFAAGERFVPEQALSGAEGAADRDLVLALEPIPRGAGPVALLSTEQFSQASLPADRWLLERCGPRVGVVVDADPSNAAPLAAQALAHHRSLGAAPRIVGPHDVPDDLDALFLAGGDPKQLVPALQDSMLWTVARAAWRAGMGLAGSSAGAMALWERCLFADEGSAVPTRWGRGLGPLRSSALAVHASSRPASWLEEVVASAPVDVVAMDDGMGVLLEAGRTPALVGDGEVRRFPSAGPVPARPAGGVLRLYHRTPAAEEILRSGFADSLANPVRDGAWEGSWFSDVPVPPADGPDGDEVLVLEVPESVAARFAWRDPAKPYRQFVLPREVANRYGPPRRVTVDGAVVDQQGPDLPPPGEAPWGPQAPG